MSTKSRYVQVPLRAAAMRLYSTAPLPFVEQSISALPLCSNFLSAITTTRSRRNVPVAWSSHERRTMTVPMTIVDFHLRHEQLPFCFFFKETLDASRLEASLKRVLQNFPVVSGQLATNQLSIRCCSVSDSVPLSIGDKNINLQGWLQTGPHQNHLHLSGRGHPTLLDLFDSLFDTNGSKNPPSKKPQNLVAIRITYFKCGGTAIGVNWNHLLGDTASLLRFVECWGREMRHKTYGRTCNVRANAACSGMSQHFVHVLDVEEEELETPLFSGYQESLQKFFGTDSSEEATRVTEMSTPHQYVNLHFSSSVLAAMKAFGMAMVLQSNGNKNSFISTNDMLTAFGWLLKRSLSGHSDYNISMVVNLRGRCGVDAFGDVKNPKEQRGLLGNAITNVIAHFPPTTEEDFGMETTALAAAVIRTALQNGLLEVPNRIAQSKHGMPLSAASTCSTFATTSWGQFPLGSIRFGEGQLVGFHGHPSHPLPLGRTFSSVICPTLFEGSMNYELLLPSDKVAHAIEIQRKLCNSFLQWHAERT